MCQRAVTAAASRHLRALLLAAKGSELQRHRREVIQVSQTILISTNWPGSGIDGLMKTAAATVLGLSFFSLLLSL